jgi:Zn-dependent protease with chaperone function/type II secretory pathway pseudopilin PulG
VNALVYPRERTLGTITLILGLIAWFALIVGTFGIALLVLAAGFVLYLFAQSGLIAHLRGNAIEISATQFPDLYEHFTACCDRLQIKNRPQAYVVNGNGTLNAFATKFLGRQFVVMNSDVIDAMSKHVDGVRFYMGHELGHLRMKHLSGHLFRWPVLWLPILGAAYSRAKEGTCDRHGLACSTSPEAAARALAALAAGTKRWAKLDVNSYVRQANESPGFWMSFHELIGGYPWLAKRFARVMDTDAKLPSRNGFAYIPALIVPYAGRLGAGFGFVIVVYIVGVLAAIAIPAYQDYTMRAKLQVVVTETQRTRDAIGSYYQSSRKVPGSLDAVGAASTLADGSTMSLDPERMLLTVVTKRGSLVFVPRADKAGRVEWSCTNGEGLKPAQVPASCRSK